MLIGGLILFGIGVVLITIGGFITMVRNPSTFNNQSRAYFDPVRKDIPADAREAHAKNQWNDPKAKWFTRIGVAFGLLGMHTLYMATNHSSPASPPTKISTTKQF